MEAIILEILTVLGCVKAKVKVGDVFWKSPASACSLLIHYSLASIDIRMEFYRYGVMVVVLQLIKKLNGDCPSKRPWQVVIILSLHVPTDIPYRVAFHSS